MSDREKRIAALNDAFRHDPGTGEHGRIMMTRGVSDLGIPFHDASARQVEIVRHFYE